MFDGLSSIVEQGGHLELPFWSVLPFVGLLLTIGIMSAVAANIPHHRAAHIWENNNYKLIIALVWATPVALLLLVLGAWTPLLESLEEYFSFLVLLFSLFAISGGIFLDGDLRAKPLVNTSFLGVGALLANVVGTTGASMLLIRAMLKSNSHRKHTIHVPVFYIFVVGNIGGCLLPIGDPPLFLGYLQGVPFFWTLNLFLPWAMALSMVLTVFYVWDTLAYRRETEESIQEDEAAYRPLKIRGSINFIWLIGVLAAVIFLTPSQLDTWGIAHGPFMFLREYVMLVLAGLSFLTSPLGSATREGNNFTFGPIIEVAFLFIGIFVAMVPALEILKAQGSQLGIDQVWQFFWVTGGLSAVLDNAPTYLTFISVTQGLVEQNGSAYGPVVTLSSGQVPSVFLAAISLGAVFMGAVTYIGNGPNFMIKAIAAEWGYNMPDFFSYVYKYAIPVLIPIFMFVTFIFFVLLWQYA
jgi:Na+/H+ antiporter NhaD/arsenite permease-like protein